MTVDSALFPTGDAPPFVTRLLELGAARREALPAPPPGAAPAAWAKAGVTNIGSTPLA